MKTKPFLKRKSKLLVKYLRLLITTNPINEDELIHLKIKIGNCNDAIKFFNKED